MVRLLERVLKRSNYDVGDDPIVGGQIELQPIGAINRWGRGGLMPYLRQSIGALRNLAVKSEVG